MNNFTLLGIIILVLLIFSAFMFFVTIYKEMVEKQNIIDIYKELTKALEEKIEAMEEKYKLYQEYIKD